MSRSEELDLTLRSFRDQDRSCRISVDAFRWGTSKQWYNPLCMQKPCRAGFWARLRACGLQLDISKQDFREGRTQSLSPKDRAGTGHEAKLRRILEGWVGCRVRGQGKARVWGYHYTRRESSARHRTLEHLMINTPDGRATRRILEVWMLGLFAWIILHRIPSPSLKCNNLRAKFSKHM